MFAVPKSASVLRKTSSAEVATPGSASGRVTVATTIAGRRPRLAAASSKLRSMRCSAPETTKNTTG